jgi:pyruvate formate lyase activating enzyme
VQEKSFGIAYTYSEPLIHVEYLMETARLARKAGVKNVIVSNGYIREKPAEDLIPLLDAANIDLKAYNQEFYRTETGGELEEVKRFISQAAGRVHLEVTTLVIPGKNDDPGQIEGIAGFLESLDPSIPLHLSRYYPSFHYTLPPTPAATIAKLTGIAKRRLSYVYAGNVDQGETNTLCPDCGNLLVRRAGYATKVEGLSGGKCGKCGRTIPITAAGEA